MIRLFPILWLPVFAACSFSALRSDDPSVSEDEVYAAGESGDVELLPHLRRIVAHHEDYDVSVVVAALDAIGKLADREAVPHIGAILDEVDEETRWHAVRALGAIGGDAALEILESVAETDPSDLVREEAALAAGR